MKPRIRLLPFGQCSDRASALDLSYFGAETVPPADVLGDRRALFFKNGRQGIDYLARKFKLSRADEVCISSTSDSNYVSSCVTCTFFNFCKVSRVPTNATKMIWIIHEFGFPNPRTEEWIEIGRKRGIPVGEDSAHSMDSFYRGKRLGHFADYGLYSLPKTFPVPTGGILIGRELDARGVEPDEQEARAGEFTRFLPFLRSISARRKEIYRRFQETFAGRPEIYAFTGAEAPFVFAFKTPRAAEIYARFEAAAGYEIEPLQTYNEHWVTLPVNPFVPDECLGALAELVAKAL